MKQFAPIVIRAVFVTYAVWATVLITDLAYCRVKGLSCDVQVAKIEGAANTIPAVLLGWLADSPIRGR